MIRRGCYARSQDGKEKGDIKAAKKNVRDSSLFMLEPFFSAFAAIRVNGKHRDTK